MHSVNVAVINAIQELNGRMERVQAENEALRVENGILRQDLKMCPFSIDNDRLGPIMGKGFLVRPFGHEGIVNIDQGENSAGQTNSISLEPIRISAAVIFFMVVTGYFGGNLQVVCMRCFVVGIHQSLKSDQRMRFHDVKLFVVQ